MKRNATAALLCAALLAGALAACGQGAAPSAGGSAPQSQSVAQSMPQSQSTPQSQSAGPAPAAGQALSQEELAALWQALGLGQSAWWCADDETVTWGGLAWPAFWVSQPQGGGHSVKYGSAWGSGVTELVLARTA